MEDIRNSYLLYQLSHLHLEQRLRLDEAEKSGHDKYVPPNRSKMGRHLSVSGRCGADGSRSVILPVSVSFGPPRESRARNRTT